MRKKPSNEHPTATIALKVVKVDKKMVPIVNWLNGFPSITTLFCCQGGKGERAADQPYVSFLCSDQVELIQVLSMIGTLATMEIDWHGGMLRYCARFWSEETRDCLTEYINHRKCLKGE